MAESGYSQSQILTMQQDAVRRVHEMQRRARAIAGNTADTQQGTNTRNTPPSSPAPPSSHVIKDKGETDAVLPVPVKAQPPNMPLNQPIPETSGGFLQPGCIEGFLEKLGIDNERLIIIGILLLLLNEGADNMLLLALVYILL